MLFVKLQRSSGGPEMLLLCQHLFIAIYLSISSFSQSVIVLLRCGKQMQPFYFESKYLIRNKGEILFIALLSALEINLPVGHSFPLILDDISQQLLLFCTDIYGPESIIPADLNDPLTCPLASAAGSHLWSLKKINKSHQELDGFPWNLFLIFRVPWDKIIMPLVIHWHFALPAVKYLFTYSVKYLLTSTWWKGKFSPDIHVSQMMFSDDFVVPLAFPPVPPWGSHFYWTILPTIVWFAMILVTTFVAPKWWYFENFDLMIFLS